MDSNGFKLRTPQPDTIHPVLTLKFKQTTNVQYNATLFYSSATYFGQESDPSAG